MRDVIDVLVIVALTLQMLTNTVILLGVLALGYHVFRKQPSENKTPVLQVVEAPPVPKNLCDHCQAELGDPASSRIIEEATVLIYQCPKCSLPSERQV